MLRLISITLLLTFSFSVFADEFSVISNNSQIALSGSSTLHGWKTIVTEIIGNAVMFITNKRLTSITNISIKIPSESLKSESESMDDLIYKSLQSKKYKYIELECRDTLIMDGHTLSIHCSLEIAGKRKNIIIHAHQVVTKDAQVKLFGSYKILMSDYDIEPPKLFLGFLKTGNEVEVTFSLIFKPTQKDHLINDIDG